MVELRAMIKENFRYLRKNRPRVCAACCMRMIGFYQRKLSRHTCLYEPTCSEYAKRCINNWGALIGILMGIWRILRCNPLSKGGYDPAPEVYWKVRWLF